MPPHPAVKSNIFIVDEGWGTLDKEHIQKISGLMSALKENFKTVLLITHIQEIKEIITSAGRIALDVRERGLEIKTKEDKSNPAKVEINTISRRFDGSGSRAAWP